MSLILGLFEGILQPTHILIILVLLLLFYGNKLPEVGRYLGKGIVEFKKGLKGLEEDDDQWKGGQPQSNPGTYAQAPAPATLEPPRPPQRVPQPTAPRFEE